MILRRQDNFRNIAKLFFVVWIIIWVNFIARDLFKKKYLYDYKILLSQDEKGKRSYTYGDYLFEFLDFCKSELPYSAAYNFTGIEENSLDERRAVYYLYPHIKRENADFLLVFNRQDFKKRDYIMYKKIDNSRFILKRTYL